MIVMQNKTAHEAMQDVLSAVKAAIEATADTYEYPMINRRALRDMARMARELVAETALALEAAE